MTPFMDELSAARTLAELEQGYEDALDYFRSRTDWRDRATAWERLSDKARIIRGHCLAYNLIPSVDVGSLHG